MNNNNNKRRQQKILPFLIVLLLLFLFISWGIYNHWTVNGTDPSHSVWSLINQQSSYLEKLRKSHGINSEKIKIPHPPIKIIDGVDPKNNHRPIKVQRPVPLKPKPNLHAVMYASHHGRDDRFCRAVESAARHKFPLVILGWQKPWRGLSQKLEAAHRYAAAMPPDDVILFTDAFDVLYTRDASTILDPFIKHNVSVMFAGECGCWPHIIEDKSACFSKYPVSPTPYRYLNSGSWIGTGRTSQDMLLEIIKRAGTNFANANDQRLAADMFIAKKFDIALDYYSTIFQSMHRTDPPDLPFCDPMGDLRFDDNVGRYRNTRTQSIPAIFHFNGGGKAHHLKMERNMWYKKREYYQDHQLRQLEEYIIKVPDSPNYPQGTITFKELCVDYINTQKRQVH